MQRMCCKRFIILLSFVKLFKKLIASCNFEQESIMKILFSDRHAILGTTRLSPPPPLLFFFMTDYEREFDAD